MRQAIRTLGYRPNAPAKACALGPSEVLAMIASAAELARQIVHKVRAREMVAQVVVDPTEGTGLEPEGVLTGLEATGYMEKVRVDNVGDIWWDPIIQGNALAMASFR